MLIVKKFGGTSVADKERIFNVANRCIEDYQKGHQVVVVLSAMGKMTDVLLAQAKDINPNASKRELDMLLTTGEQTSVALMAMAMDSLGVPAVSLNAFQVAMNTTETYSNARLKRIDTDRIKHELSNKKIVIVTGFQGINKYDDYTTLGRGGSDTTAVALASALRADACEIYTDVDGVYTADPRIVKNASKLDEITYDEMLELASLGAGVLHNRSVEMAKKYGGPQWPSPAEGPARSSTARPRSPAPPTGCVLPAKGLRPSATRSQGTPTEPRSPRKFCAIVQSVPPPRRSARRWLRRPSPLGNPGLKLTRSWWDSLSMRNTSLRPSAVPANITAE